MTDIELLTTYRQEMHKIQIKNGFTNEQMTSYRQGFMDAIREYEQRIAADVQPIKHGRWVCEFYNDVFDVYQADCSVCMKESTEKYDKVSESYEYCPHCGAIMDLKDGDTE